MSESPFPAFVHKSITVRCDVATAFRVWTESLNTWWPKGHSRSGDPNTTVHLEPHIGGRLYERTSESVEHEWGEVTAWEPPHHLAYYWFLGSGPTQPTHVEIHFQPLAPNQTRVEVYHRGPELIGALWSQNSARYDAAWEAVLGAFVPWASAG